MSYRTIDPLISDIEPQCMLLFQLKVLSNDCDTLHYAISTVIQLLMSYNIKDEIIVPQLLVS